MHIFLFFYSERLQMKLSKFLTLFISPFVLSALTCSTSPASEFTNSAALSEDLSKVFEQGRYEMGLNSGVLFSPFAATKGRPTINYTITELQLGYMLTDVKQAGWLRGNVEILGNGFGGTIFRGSGKYVAGGTLWLRYNLIPANSRFGAYAQAGAGLTFTDIDREMVGQRFNFNLDLALGIRYFMRSDLALNLEYRYQHISNSNMAQHNIGINSHGPVLGASYFF
jgi:hypothetical protein